MLVLVFSVLLGFFQVTETGTIVGIVKLPNGSQPAANARIVLLPPKYTELWNKQVQQRLDNYWEAYKPEFAAHKERIMEFYRAAHVESLRSVTSTMRRELGDGASMFIKDTGPNGQFEFKNIPFGTYQVLVQAANGAEEVVWSQTVEVHTGVPIFVDLGKPVS